jgi:predicted  nucleic acid-binding Zn-ribbon protein
MTDFIALLHKISAVDRRLSELSEQEEKIPRELQALEEGLKSEEKAADEERLGLEKAQGSRKTLEVELESTNEHINKYQAQLFQVKTNKEYTALLAEISAHKAKNSQTEDRILALMEEVEDRTKRLQIEKDKLAKVRTEYARRTAELESQLAAVKAEHTQRDQERAGILPDLPKDLLPAYERVHRSRKGLAIVPVRDGTCGGCHVNLPPQRLVEVRQGEEVVSCEHCGRILIWESA